MYYLISLIISLPSFWPLSTSKIFTQKGSQKITKNYTGHFSAQRIHQAKGQDKTTNRGGKSRCGAPLPSERHLPSLAPQKDLGKGQVPNFFDSTQNPTMYPRKNSPPPCCSIFILAIWASIFKFLWWDCSSVCDSVTHPIYFWYDTLYFKEDDVTGVTYYAWITHGFANFKLIWLIIFLGRASVSIFE
jgi:hypothetical protein